MGKAYEEMTHEEKCVFFASGRCSAGRVEQIMDGDDEPRVFYIPRVRGHYVRLAEILDFRYKTEAEALEAARLFREVMRKRVLRSRSNAKH